MSLSVLWFLFGLTHFFLLLVALFLSLLCSTFARGKDFRYEYQVSPPDSDTTGTPLSGGTRKNGRKPHRKHMEISSFLANRDNWTSDFSYLESLLSSEDKSHPDREMVLLWCMRQGLKHYETSAATGEGVKEAVKALIQLALEEKEQRERASNVQSIISPPRREKLDLHQRYASKENDCFFWMCPLIQGFRK